VEKKIKAGGDTISLISQPGRPAGPSLAVEPASMYGHELHAAGRRFIPARPPVIVRRRPDHGWPRRLHATTGDVALHL